MSLLPSPAPIATGWSDSCRAGFAPAREWRLSTAHDHEALWTHVTAAGARHGMLDIGLDGMDIRRIEAAILNNGSDVDHAMSAWAAGLGPFVDLAKSDFFGRDALDAMTDRRTRMYGLTCKTAEPLIGGPVARNAEEIGRITASGWSPHLEQSVAYVRLACADDLEPRSVEVMGFDLAMHEASIVDLPFYDPQKRIPRGLEVAAW